MALQRFTKAPFRVVDEINQGMDSVNERMIHRRMVEVACQESTAQYFLVTPKLLTNLHYHPHMSISCIFAGTQVDKQGVLSFDTTATLNNLASRS
jgi:chromosome segregation ATPase